MSREQIIQDTAYAIWEAEGKPHGRAAHHWKQAEEHVAASLAGSAKQPAKAKASAKPTSAEAKPAAKTVATKTAPQAKGAVAAKSPAKKKG